MALSLRVMCRRWILTVFSDRLSCRAIHRFDRPLSKAVRTSFSRAVKWGVSTTTTELGLPAKQASVAISRAFKTVSAPQDRRSKSRSLRKIPHRSAARDIAGAPEPYAAPHGQVLVQAVADRPADHPPGEQIQHHGQVQPALVGPHV